MVTMSLIIFLLSVNLSCSRQKNENIGTSDNDPAIVTDTNEVNNNYRIFTLNRRGMAFPDRDFSVSAIFPPANFIVAQVVQLNRDASSMPIVLDDSQLEIRYSAVPDLNGSINTHSANKTNFWQYADDLYYFYLGNQSIHIDEGFHGKTTLAQSLPGLDNLPRLFSVFDGTTKTFTAPYIPSVPIDDSGLKNYYPLYRIDAVDRVTQRILASAKIPLPMAEPMNCELCHATGKVAADETTSQRYQGLMWSNHPDADNNAKENIAILHAAETGLDILGRIPYLCAECHYSPIADPDGRGPAGDHQLRRNKLSISIHALHGLDLERKIPDDNGDAIIPENGEANCKICHGGDQSYTRGVMHQAGIYCQDCHGGMIAVGKSPLVGASEIRTPFIDEPRCESCHTGDEVSHRGQDLVYRRAYESNDIFAAPRLAFNRRFAEQVNTLYRASTEHGGMTCISCHGSPHAIWPVEISQSHDNDIAIDLQGHDGSIIECSSCHKGDLVLSLSGPHGLHNINDDNWVKNHGAFFNWRKPELCQSCHGLNLQGGRLSKTAAVRTFSLPGGYVMSYQKGQFVGCSECHAMPAY